MVCTQLGLGQAIAATTNGFFGQAEGEYIKDNVECSGEEASIKDCQSSNSHNCDNIEAAGVICHIVPHRKFDRISGTSSATFPNFNYVAPREICVERNCFDSPIAK